MRKYILGALIGIVSIGYTYGYGNLTQGFKTVNVNEPTVIGNYTLTFDENFNVNTNDAKLYYHDTWGTNNGRYFAWKNGNLYFYSKKSTNTSITSQGFIANWCVDTTIENCINGTFNISLENIIEQDPNIESVLIGTNTNNYAYAADYANSYLCFYDGNKYYCAACSTEYGCLGGFTGSSLGLQSINFSDISSYAWENSPFTQTTPTQTPITQYACPTIQQLINAYPEQYNTSLCYSSTTIYSGGQYIQTTPKTIFELYEGGTYVNVRNDINTYFNYCRPPATMQACQNAFTGREENYTFVSKLPEDIQPIRLRQYCNMTLNMDPNATTCTYSTGMINTGISLDDIAREIGDSQRTVITPGKPSQGTGNESGSVYDKYLGDEEDENNMFELVRKAKDVIKNMKSIYVKITGIFRGRTGTNGVIPEYITGLICLIVLYKLFKK